jgi:malate dehydrogenase (oxaloacetate-decarboxylating)
MPDGPQTAQQRAPVAATRWDPAANAWTTSARGRAVLSEPRINKGVAFPPAERRALGLTGLLPPAVLTLDQQAGRAYAQYSSQPNDLAKYVFLTALHDRNEVLFYRLLGDHLREMLPVVYTPTVGQAIERYSHEYRRPRGIYLTVDAPDDVEVSLRASGLGPGDVDLLVATDAEAILGIGDWGVGGMDIAIGKLAVYTAAGGIDPARAIGVMLDVGTDRQSLLEDPLYLGSPHPRVDRGTYDAFLDRYVQTARRLFPDALLHWEDLGPSNARRLLDRYRGSVLTFNDDMEGTGAVNLAAVLSGVKVSGVPLREHRAVVFGSGTAGIGVADQLRDAMVADGLDLAAATRRVWCLDRHGLLTDAMPDLMDFQVPYARPAAEVAGWASDPDLGGVPLLEVVARTHPTILVGTSTRAGAFSQPVVREMAAHTDRPIVLPMSNPTRLAEAVPSDLLAWTGGRALVATGSPFPPVTLGGVTYVIGQANNALVFPGLGLGVIAARASRVTDAMLRAAAGAVAGMVDPTTPGAPLLPQVEDLRATSAAVAAAVARAAVDGGVARCGIGEALPRTAQEAMWQPVYRAVMAV